MTIALPRWKRVQQPVEIPHELNTLPFVIFFVAGNLLDLKRAQFNLFCLVLMNLRLSNKNFSERIGSQTRGTFG